MDQVTYIFSVLAGSAIYNFVVIREDGSRIVGVVKEKEQAQQEWSSAKRAGELAVLGQEATKDGTFTHSQDIFLPALSNRRFLQFSPFLLGM